MEFESYLHVTASNLILQDISVSSDGESIVVIGYYNGRVQIPTGKSVLVKGDLPQNNYQTDYHHFVLCYSKDGELKWNLEVDGPMAYDSQLDRIKISPSGDIHYIHAFSERAVFGKKMIEEHSKSGQSVGWFLLDKNGKLKSTLRIWKQRYRYQDEEDQLNDIQIIDLQFDAKGNGYLYGNYALQMDLSYNIQLHSKEPNDYAAGFLAKYDPNNELQWFYKLSGPSWGGRIEAFHMTADGSLYFAGIFNDHFSISSGQSIVLKTEKTVVGHSGTSMFYGKIDGNGELKFVKYHLQKKHYTNCMVSTLWLDQTGRVNIMGIYEDSLKVEGLDKTIFGGMHLDTIRTEYNGKVLSSVHEQYYYDMYHMVWQEEKLLSLESVFKFNYGVGNINFANRIITAEDQLYFFVKDSINAEIKGGDRSDVIQNERRNSSWVKLNYSQKLPPVLSTETDSMLVYEPLDNKLEVNKISAHHNDVHETEIDSLRLPETTVMVYPNPVETIVNIEVKNIENSIDLRIYNQLGQLIFTQVERSSSQQFSESIDLSGLASGQYFIHIHTGDFDEVVPVIKVN